MTRALLLILLASATLGPGCNAVGPADRNAAIERFPPTRLDPAFGATEGVYLAGSSYRIYLDASQLKRSRETRITKDTLSILITVGPTRSRYQTTDTAAGMAPWLVAHDGTRIYPGPALGSGVVAASRMLGPDVEILYSIHESRLQDLARIDRQVVETLSHPSN